jgi:hypothetical protein
MTIKKHTFKKGIVLKPDTEALDGINGELKVDSADGKIKSTLGGSPREIITNDQTQTLTNKTINSSSNTLTVNADEASVSNLELDNLKTGVLDTDLTSVSGSDDTIPSAKAVKTYVDAVQDNLDDHINETVDAHDASAISVVPTGNLAADDVQEALEELQGDINTLNTGLSDHLSDAVDAHDASAISSIPSGNLAATEVQAALNELQSDIDTRALNSDLTTHTGASTGVHGVTGSVVGTTDTQTLTNKTITGASIQTPSRLDAKQDTKANLVTYASTATDGQFVFATDEEKMYQVLNNGLVELGAGGGIGSVDILFADTFEDTVIADYSVTGTVVVTETLAEVIQGEKTLKITHTGGATAKRTLDVSNKFQNRICKLSFDYYTTATSGNFNLTIEDETNSAILVNAEVITPQGADYNSSKRSVTFTIPETCDNLSYLFTAVSESGVFSYVDNVVIELGQQASIEGEILVPVVTEWVDNGVITVTGVTSNPTKGTTSIDKVYSRRVGDMLQAKYDLRITDSSGAAGSGHYLFALPSGLQVDTSKLNFDATNPTVTIGLGHVTNTSGALGTSTHTARAVLHSATQFKIIRSTATVGTQEIIGSSLFAFNSTTAFSLQIDVPILNWDVSEAQTIPLTQAALVQESDSMIQLNTRGSGAAGYGSTNTAIARFTTLQSSIGSDITYSDSATLGASFTINTDGIYSISYTAAMDNAGDRIGISKNSNELTTAIQAINVNHRLATEDSSVAGVDFSCSWSGYLQAGDIIRPHNTTSASVTVRNARHHFTISKQGSLSQINVSETDKLDIPTSELRFEGASARGGTATAIVKFDTMTKLRGDAFTVVNTAADGTYVQMKKAGKLDVSANVRLSNSTFQLTKNQVTLTSLSSTSSEILASTSPSGTSEDECISWTGFVVAGDIIRVASGQNPGSVVYNNLNLTFQEQSVQVSVSNLLPQFSETDSSVRVDTANGYGSTATKIRRFSNVRDNLGSDITYADSATDGASFTVNTDGVYSISFSDNFTAASDFGISKNASSLTTNFNALSSAERLAFTTTGASGYNSTAAGDFYLLAGDVIRAHTQGIAASTAAQTTFTISKVGKPNITGVDLTRFIHTNFQTNQQISHTAAASTLLDRSSEARFTLSNLVNAGSAILAIEDDSGNSRTKFVATKGCTVDVSVTGPNNAAGYAASIYKNGVVAIGGNTIGSGSGQQHTVSGQLLLNKDDFITVGMAGDSFSNNSDPVRLLIMATAEVEATVYTQSGTENTFSAIIANNGTATITSQSYTFIQSVNRSALGVVDITFVSGFFSQTPSVIVNPTSAAVAGNNTATKYNVTTSGLQVITEDKTNTEVDIGFTISVQRQSTDYKNPNAYAVVVPQQVAYLKDVKAQGTSGGSSVSNSWTTRDLNTLTGSSFVTLSSNQFTLQKGVYDIEAIAPFYRVNTNKIRLQNITDGVTEIIGDSMYAEGSYNVSVHSKLIGSLTLTSTKTFAIQYIAGVAFATSGLGVAGNWAGTSEVYTQVKITKLSST